MWGDCMLYQFRSKTRSTLISIARKIDVPFITPNRLTLLSIPFAIVAAYFIFYNNYLTALVFVAISFFIDALDGALATVRNEKTPLGNYLDSMADRVVEAILYLGFIVQFPFATILAFSLGIIATHTKALVGEVIEADNRDWPGMGGRPDRAILLFGGMVIAIIIPYSNGLFTVELFLYLISLVVIVGNVQRILFARKILQN
jgi:archaetidylinositol phosphate synthase